MFNMYVSTVSFLEGPGSCVPKVRPCFRIMACCCGRH